MAVLVGFETILRSGVEGECSCGIGKSGTAPGNAEHFFGCELCCVGCGVACFCCGEGEEYAEEKEGEGEAG